MNPGSILNLIRFDKDSFLSLEDNFLHRRVSYFDHFLSNDEFDECQFLYYQLALESDALPSYMVAEERLLDLWERLARAGRNFTLADGRVDEIPSLTETMAIGMNVMRDTGGCSVCFDGAGVVWEPSFDLTHLIWMPKSWSWEYVEQMVNSSGLHFLD